jgi:uncharacterized membrane protein YciS (DUF1049 family)
MKYIRLILIVVSILIASLLLYNQNKNQVTSTIKITYTEKKDYKIITTVNRPISDPNPVQIYISP